MTSRKQLATRQERRAIALQGYEEVFELARQAKTATGGKVDRAIAVAAAIADVEEIFAKNAELKRCIKAMAGKQLGYFVDKEYPDDVLVQCATTAALELASIAGGQYGIISGKVFLTGQYWKAQLLDHPQISCEPRIVWGRTERDPSIRTAFVSATVHVNRYNMHPVRIEFTKRVDEDGRLAIVLNEGLQIEAIRGKARRVIYREILWLLENNGMPDDTDTITARDVGNVIDEPSEYDLPKEQRETVEPVEHVERGEAWEPEDSEKQEVLGTQAPQP